MLAWLSIWSEV